MWQVRVLRSDARASATLALSPADLTTVVKTSSQKNLLLAGTPTAGWESSFAPGLWISNGEQQQPRLRFTNGHRRLAVDRSADPPTVAAFETVAIKSAGAVPAADNPGPTAFKKYTLHIDALRNLQLAKPIPVTIEPLGERVFVAEAFELNLSMTGRTPEDAILLLKGVITRTYEGSRTWQNTLDPEHREQQRLLDTYINRPKGRWHWA